MSTVLILLALSALVALVVRRLDHNDARGRSAPWLSPPGSDASHDRDGERVRAELRASAASRAVQPAATTARGTNHRWHLRLPHVA